jgi:hypothetical protein
MKAIAKLTDHLPKKVFGKTLMCISSLLVDAWRWSALVTLTITKTKKAMITTATTTISAGFILNNVPPLNRISESILKTIILPEVSGSKLGVTA